MSGKSRTSGNRSFGQLAELVKKSGIHLKAQAVQPDSPAAKLPTAKPISLEPASDPDEKELFSREMNDVQRSSWRHDPHPHSKPVTKFKEDPALEDRRLMQAAMDENSPLEILDHPEYIEGWIGVAGQRFLPNLRNGLYSIQGQIDLHGLNKNEAQVAVEKYIMQMSRAQSCCVKIIHGRGINSPTDRATLKEGLQRLLSTRRMSRYVVAYSSAPSCDGGVGAVYVLLCRQ